MSRQTRAGMVVCAAAVLASCSSSDTTQPDSGTPDSGITPNTQGWWRDKVFYEIFVRSFADSNGDGIGDLSGLTGHLDALNDGDAGTGDDLEVDAVWLMPIHPSPSYHGYDVLDYRNVNSQYGSLADLDAFVAAAHRRGVKVIIDMVLNHSARQHPWFINSQTGPDAEKRNWYVWRSDDPGWLQPFGAGRTWWNLNGAYYYGVFTSGMPDLNLTNGAVEDELVDTMKFWLARGIDGFRLDAVRYFIENAADAGQADQPETHAFLKRIRGKLQAQYPDTLLVAEAWTVQDIALTYYGNGDEVQLGFAFDLAEAIKTAVAAGDASNIVNTLARTDELLAGKDRGYDAPFLSNHDQPRVMRVLGADAAAVRVSAAVLFAVPGTPFVYYGEELGMQGGAGADDRNKRTPYPWDGGPGHGFTTGNAWVSVPEASGVDLETERADPGSLFHLYRKLIALRHAQTPLSKGSVTRPALSGAPASVMALLREDSGKRVLFLANVGNTDSGAFGVQVSGTPSVLLQEGLDGTPTVASGSLAVPGLGSRGFVFLSL
ncbi:MAG TPA: alpha-amylase family glycosyl hydrolase [Myxococcaceae bacterium]|nr:alpha-amylase family glycosyl hydrolase [Myxococcaceae bacterium]